MNYARFCSTFNDINNELPSKTTCKYYSVNEFQNLNKKGF